MMNMTLCEFMFYISLCASIQSYTICPLWHLGVHGPTVKYVLNNSTIYLERVDDFLPVTWVQTQHTYEITVTSKVRCRKARGKLCKHDTTQPNTAGMEEGAREKMGDGGKGLANCKVAIF